jgi:hypothetical protein
LVFATSAFNTAIRIEKQRLRDGIDDVLRVLGEWNVDPGGPLDLPYLPQEYVENNPIDGIVCAIEQAGLDFRRLLAEAINATLALLEAVWIPWEIVVQDTSKELLKIDTLAETVGRYEDAGLITRHLLNPFPSHVIWIFTGNDLEIKLWMLLAEYEPQVFA